MARPARWTFPLTPRPPDPFCNVLRVRRRLELIEAAIFVANIGFWFAVDQFNWWFMLACQMPVTLTVLIYEIRNDRYHGIFRGKQQSAWKRSICRVTTPRGAATG